MIYIIEHLEPRLGKWCFEEYRHISQIVGKSNLWFTNTRAKTLKKLGKVISKKAERLGLERVCVLDPFAKKALSSKDAKRFDYFIFGGILGDNPPQKRTGEVKIKGAERRNMGKVQFSTDNAVFVAKNILAGKKLKFMENPEIPITKNMSVLLPYRYAVIGGKPLIPKEILNLLKRAYF